jgi:PII-like signaling protein
LSLVELVVVLEMIQVTVQVVEEQEDIENLLAQLQDVIQFLH